MPRGRFVGGQWPSPVVRTEPVRLQPFWYAIAIDHLFKGSLVAFTLSVARLLLLLSVIDLLYSDTLGVPLTDTLGF